jgi:hypothetical protein
MDGAYFGFPVVVWLFLIFDRDRWYIAIKALTPEPGIQSAD